MKDEKDLLEVEKIRAEITHLMAQTLESGKRARWYEITIAIAGTLAVVAVIKLLLT